MKRTHYTIHLDEIGQCLGLDDDILTNIWVEPDTGYVHIMGLREGEWQPGTRAEAYHIGGI